MAMPMECARCGATLQKRTILCDSCSDLRFGALLMRAATFIDRYTVCLFKRRPTANVPVVAGTAVLFEIAGQHFLLTAAHVVEPGLNKQVTLYVPVGDRRDLIPFAASVLSTKRPRDGPILRTDIFDIAAIPLTRTDVRAIGKDHEWIRLERCRFRHAVTPSSVCAVFGYPDEGRKADPAKRSLSVPGTMFAVVPYTGRRLKDYRPGINLAFNFHSDRLFKYEDKSWRSFEPEGISGCGVWRLFDHQPGRSWSETELALIAIQNRHNRNEEVLKTTTIGCVVRMIYENMPELRRSIDLHDWR